MLRTLQLVDSDGIGTFGQLEYRLLGLSTASQGGKRLCRSKPILIANI